MVANSMARVNKLVMGLSTLMEKECRTTMFFDEMDIAELFVYAQQIEESKLGR